jgi:phosphoadenosine phosphosulfate reductase
VAWITGQRAEQSPNRAGVALAEVDAMHDLVKVNPLADWRRRDVERFVADHSIPYNVLHDRSFPSIGCAPCTRAVRLGEPERAGRWWWEAEAKKECGLHLPLAAAGLKAST